MIPDVFMPGFPKAASTSIRNALSTDPRVVLIAGSLRSDRIAGASQTPVIEESEAPTMVIDRDVTYVGNPSILRLIEKINPESKFVFTLRHPVDRAVSQYRFAASLGNETRSMSGVISSDGEHNTYVQFSRYESILARYFERFPSQNFLFIDLFYREFEREIHRLNSFLGLTLTSGPQNEYSANQTVQFGSVGRALLMSPRLRQSVPTRAKRLIKPYARRLATLGQPAALDVDDVSLRWLACVLERDIAAYERLREADGHSSTI